MRRWAKMFKVSLPSTEKRLKMTYLTLDQVREKLGGRARSTIYLDIKHGRLPEPFKFGARVYWHAAELEAHLDNLRGALTATSGDESPSEAVELYAGAVSGKAGKHYPIGSRVSSASGPDNPAEHKQVGGEHDA